MSSSIYTMTALIMFYHKSIEMYLKTVKCFKYVPTNISDFFPYTIFQGARVVSRNRD